MAINDSSISVDVYNEVNTILTSAAPYISNSSTSTTTAAEIRVSYNDKEITKPQIIIHPIVYNESDYKFGSNNGKKFVNVIIDCYYKNSLGVDQLFDQVTNALKNTTLSGMEMVGISSDVAFVVPNDNKFHMKSGVYTYDRE